MATTKKRRPKKDPRSAVEQLKGAARLAIDATQRVVDVVESMHHTIGGGPEVLGRPLETLTKLVSSPVYGAIRAVTNVVGFGIEATLTLLEPYLHRPGTERGAFVAALNGVVGDYLAETHNPLAIDMALCFGGAVLNVTRDSLLTAVPEGRRLLVLVHGSCLDETCWQRPDYNHGTALATALGLTPVYLRYNSGLHISQNGAMLAARLEDLMAAWPWPVEEIVLLGHSMGGLVARAACHVGEAAGHDWRRRLRALVTIGSPHQGTLLERGGNLFETLLGISRYSAPLAGLGRLRSAGVTDLRYGYVLDEHWRDHDRFARVGDRRGVLTLPEGVACYAVAGSAGHLRPGKTPRGDGLVSVASALGRHKDPARALDFPPSHQWVATRTGHVELLRSPEVGAKLQSWLSTEPTSP